MTQHSTTPALFRTEPPSNGTPTSKAAAVAIAPHVNHLERMVLDCIAACGEHGCTDDEGEVRTGLNHQTYTPRRLALQRKSLVVDTGKTRATRSNRQAAIWRANAQHAASAKGSANG